MNLFFEIGAEGSCHGNQVWDAICYNWVVIASGTIFDSRGGFSGSSCLMKS